MAIIFADSARLVNPAPSPFEVVLADRLAWLADGGDLDEYRPGWSDPQATELEDAEWLGFRLGLDGVPAEALAPCPEERRAFDRGHNGGDAELWRIDPLFAAAVASHVKVLVSASLTF